MGERPVTLAKNPGKYVLVDFWATDCFPCLEEIAQIRSAYERYRRDARIEFISLDLDQSRDRAERFVRANKMEWQQGYLEQGWQNPVTKNFGVDAIPAIFLIDPEGKIVARGLRGSSIEATLSDLLGK